MTALSMAFEAVGIKPATDRLRQAAVDALASNPRNIDGAKDAVFSAVRNDAALLWELFARYRDRAVNELLSDVAATLRQEVGGGQANGAKLGQESISPAIKFERAASGILPQQANRTVPHRSEPIPIRPTAARGITGMAAVAKVAALSLLDTFKVEGAPIGDLTPNQANTWATKSERGARFVRMLTANLPPNLPIRKYRTAEEAALIYAQAQA